MKDLPLIADYHPEATVAWLDGAPVSQSALLGTARELAQRLPAGGSLINLCESRFGFMAAFVAGLVSGRSNLLPPNRLPATLELLRALHPDAVTLSDVGDAGALAVPRQPDGAGWDGPCPAVPAQRIAAIVFTSGSTGTPREHRKTWHNLVMTAAFACQRLELQGRCITATVPAQHMYGLETTVMPALAGGAISFCGRPMFPQDLRDALAGMPMPRVLVTTPVHLHAFVQSGLGLPDVEKIVSATAPLSVERSRQAEAYFRGQVYEIYGCTEAGSIATRRTVEGPEWTPYPGVELRTGCDGTQVCGPHLPAPVCLEDLIQTEADGRFRLLGRTADMIKVAGKRASLQDLTQKLLAVPGVEDGVVFVPQPDADVARLAALVIAPTRSEAEILHCLAQQLDPAFLPRPLRRVDRLPRNEVGKLPRAALLALLNG